MLLQIIENKYGFTEVLKHVNDMAHRIDLEKYVLAEETFSQFSILNLLGVSQKQRDLLWPLKRMKIFQRRLTYVNNTFYVNFLLKDNLHTDKKE